MSTFLLVAAVMAAIAASTVAVPLLRGRQSRLLAALAGAVVIGAAAGLYTLWSSWDWHAAGSPTTAAVPDVAAMVHKLEQRLQEEPGDLAGWLMLGRSYLTLNRLDDAVVAYDHARRLDGKSTDAAMGLGEAMSLRAGGEITSRAAQLFEEALAYAPSNPQALLYGGFAAASRGDTGLARRRWETLKSMNPPPQIVELLDARIAELGPPHAAPAADAAGEQRSGGTSASSSGTDTSAADLPAGEVTVNISIAPALKSRLKSEAPLFVFAREPGSKGPPLAVKRLTSAAIGTRVRLSSADSMLQGRTLAKGREVSITARISFGGQPVASAGDLYGELSYAVGRDGVRDLVIDRVAE